MLNTRRVVFVQELLSVLDRLDKSLQFMTDHVRVISTFAQARSLAAGLSRREKVPGCVSAAARQSATNHQGCFDLLSCC